MARKLTIITLANGANFAVDGTPDEIAEQVSAGKLGTDQFIRFTAMGEPVHLSKGTLEAVLAIFPQQEGSVEVVKGNDAQRFAPRRT